MDRMSELTKKLHILKTGGTEEEVTLYDSTDDCEEPYLSFTVDGANAYAKLGETTDDNATSLRIYRNSDKATYAVLKTAAVIIDDLFTQIVMRTVTEIIDDGEQPLITSIGDYAFYYCSNLTSIDLPAATSIGVSAFGYCSNLTSIDLPAATSIGGSAFSSCSSLKEIHFSAANKAKIEANSYYSSKWDATNATIYFDL